jgi:hypothetical protein
LPAVQRAHATAQKTKKEDSPSHRVRNLKTGKEIVAEEISNRLKNVEVYFPVHNGAELLVVKRKKHIKIKVNENYYERGRTWPSCPVFVKLLIFKAH